MVMEIQQEKVQMESELDAYLASTVSINWQNQSVIRKSNELCEGLDSDLEKISVLFNYVRDHIYHSRDVQLGIVDFPELREDLDEFMDQVVYKASNVLEKGHGICFAQSHLLAALLRAQGIPAGLCYQVLKKDSPRTGKVVHGLNAVYLKDRQEWVILDARLPHVEFHPDQDNLAYEMDAIQGELLYPGIYADTHPKILDLLNRFTSRRVLWPYLLHRLD